MIITIIIKQEFRSKIIFNMYPKKQRRVVGSISKVKYNFKWSAFKIDTLPTKKKKMVANQLN